MSRIVVNIKGSPPRSRSVSSRLYNGMGCGSYYAKNIWERPLSLFSKTKFELHGYEYSSLRTNIILKNNLKLDIGTINNLNLRNTITKSLNGIQMTYILRISCFSVTVPVFIMLCRFTGNQCLTWMTFYALLKPSAFALELPFLYWTRNVYSCSSITVLGALFLISSSRGTAIVA